MNRRLEGWIQLNFIERDETGGGDYVNNYGEKMPRQVRANLVMRVECPACGSAMVVVDDETIVCLKDGCMYQDTRFERPAVWLTRKTD